MQDLPANSKRTHSMGRSDGGDRRREGSGTVRTPEADPPAKALRVLVVDDDPSIGEIIAEYLGDEGHTVAIASGGVEALEAFLRGTFDAVVTDRDMPDLDGAQLARLLKARNPALPIVMVTAHANWLRDGELPAGVDALIGKPFDPDSLVSALGEACRERRT